MARGLPAVWSVLAASPVAAIGGYVTIVDTGYSPLLGVPFLLFAGLIALLGIFVHVIAAPEGPSMRTDEELIATRHPVQRVATVKVIIGLPLLGIASYLFFETMVPLVYPTVALLAGLYFFSTGFRTYWVNSLTTYYLTDRRVIREYRFLALSRQEVPLDKVRGVEERRSFAETLVGLGNVRINSGSSGALTVAVSNITSPRQFADEVRQFI